MNQFYGQLPKARGEYKLAEKREIAQEGFAGAETRPGTAEKVDVARAVARVALPETDRASEEAGRGEGGKEKSASSTPGCMERGKKNRLDYHIAYIETV